MRTALVCGVVLFLAAPAARANLITNGSFEIPTNPPGPNGFAIFPAIPGWTSPGGIEIQRNSVLGAGNVAQDGLQYVELNVNGPTSLSQDISGLQVGQQYLLTFYYSARPGTGANTAVATFEGNPPIPLAAGPVGQIAWLQFSRLVTVTDSTSTLTFTGLTPNTSLGNLLDNVSLVQVAVPEPATLAVFGALAAGAFGLRRRVRRA